PDDDPQDTAGPNTMSFGNVPRKGAVVAARQRWSNVRRIGRRSVARPQRHLDARREVAAALVRQRRDDGRTVGVLKWMVAAGMERATARRVRGGRDVAAKYDPVPLPARVRHRHRRE